MALFNNKLKAAGSGLGVSVTALRETLKANRDTIFSPTHGKQFLGLGNESDGSNVNVVTVQQHFDDIVSSLNSVANESETPLTNQQKESAARAAMLYANGNALAETFGKVRKAHGMENIGNESFSNEKMTEIRDYAIALAVAASADRKTAGEAIYPTMQLNADFVATEVSLPRFEFLGQDAHVGDGESITDWQRRHITDAGRVAGLLNRNDNVMQPRVVTGSNEALLAPAAKAPYKTVTGRDGSVYQVGEVNGQATDPINLLTLSRAPGQSATGNLNFNDRIDDGAVLNSIRVGFGDGDDTIVFPVGDQTGAQFSKLGATSSENVRNISMDSLKITIDLNGTEAQATPVLKALADAGYNYAVISTPLMMSLHLHKGTLTQSPGTFKLVGVYQTIGGSNFIAEAGIAAAVAAVKPTYVSPIFHMTLSSRSLRVEGLRVQSRTITKQFTLRARGVITSEKEINTTNVDSELGAMNSARSLAKESDAVEHFITEATTMCEKYGTDGTVIPDPEQTQHAGMYYIAQPYCKNDGSLTAASIVKELDTDDRVAKLSGSLSALIAENFVAMVTKAGYITPVRTYAGNNARIKACIVVGSVLSRYLQTPGEDDFLGNLDEKVYAKPEVVVSELDVMDDRIMVIPAVEGAEGDSAMVFGFGYCIESPALVYDVPVDRDGQSARRLQLSPFYEFVTNLPMVYMVKVTGVEAWLKQAA